MRYTSKQTQQEPTQSPASSKVSPTFSDQRASTAVQLKQQHMMHYSHAFQKKPSEENVREVHLTQLPEDQARQHLVDSFKKGKMENPLVDSAGNVVQRLPKKTSHSGGDLFTVLKSDLNTGTVTSQGTRNYVNDPSTFKPDAVLFDYASANSTKKSTQTVTGNKNAYEVENPESDRPYKSGRYWDAGHKLGRQNGGLGNDDDWVFPQNPAFNQGNSRNMDDVEETHPLWRSHEDAFHEGVEIDGGGTWWIKLI